jgi:large subunit ribosomal protein L36e
LILFSSYLFLFVLQREGQRTKLVRGVVREVTGYAPYERRLMEILKGGGNNPTKRAWRFAKKRLGTHIRAKRKVVEMGDVIASSKKAEAAAKAAAAKAAAK